MTRRKSFLFLKHIIVGIAVAIGGWAVFDIIKLSMAKLFLSIGIVSEIGQAFAILILVIVVLMMIGMGLKKSLLKLFGD